MTRFDSIQKEEKNSKISKDEAHRYIESVQKITDEMTGEIDKVVKAKDTKLKD